MRHWQANGLKPHLVCGFKISRYPKFVEKLEDIVGLHMSPPEHTLVLYCDQKSQVQALDRTQPGLPLNTGRAQTMTHDYTHAWMCARTPIDAHMDKRVTKDQDARRRHSDALKRELVERSLEPRASVAAIAQEAGVNANLLFNWRRLHLQAQVPAISAAASPVLLNFPRAHWLQIHSKNPLEPLNAEIKRRTNLVGIFPNDAAMTRLVGAMLQEQYDEWSVNRRYMPLEGLQSLSDTALARVPAGQR
jgi:hypothetical protein